MKIWLLVFITASTALSNAVISEALLREFSEQVVTALIADADVVPELETFMQRHNELKAILNNIVLFENGDTLQAFLLRLDPRLFERVGRVAHVVLPGVKLNSSFKGDLKNSIKELEKLPELDSGSLYKISLLEYARRELNTHDKTRAALIQLIQHGLDKPARVPQVSQAVQSYLKRYPGLPAIDLGDVKYKDTTVKNYLQKHPEAACYKTYKSLFPKSFAKREVKNKSEELSENKKGSFLGKLIVMSVVAGAGYLAYRYYLKSKKEVSLFV